MTAQSSRILFMCLILDLLSRRYALDDISISTGAHKGPMIVGDQYVLECDVHNKSVFVRWYKRQHLLNQTVTHTFNSSVNNTLRISPNRTDNGAQYWCEAELKSGGSQLPTYVTSKPLNITVYFKPIINEIKLPSIVPVFRGYEMVLVCEAEGNPKPNISWSLSTNDPVYNETLTITDPTPEDVYCIASNSVNTTIRHVKVVLKEDYLPLIAGLVAITVAFISVIFIFIYSIYYKTAKTGRYSLKDAKPSAQNGSIAQNGKDNTIPMKKLSQSNIFA